MNKKYNLLLIGFIFLLVFILNEFTLGYIFAVDREINNPLAKVSIRLFDAVLLLTGIFVLFAKNALRYIKLLLMNLSILIVGILLLELIFGNWLRQKNINHEWIGGMRNITFHYDISKIYKFPINPITYKRDKYGLRGYYSSLSEIDILTMGGSTTDQRYIHEGYTFQDIMQQEFLKAGLNISVVNAGTDGRTTYGMLKDFEWWISKLPNLKVRHFLFYIGINDFYPYNEDLWHGLDLGDKAIIDIAYITMPLFGAIEKNSAIYRTIRIIKGMYMAKDAELAYGGNKISRMNEWRWTDKPNLLKSMYNSLIANHLDVYANRIDQLCKQASKMGGVPIVVTQKYATYYKDERGRVIGRDKLFRYSGVFINGVDQYWIMKLLNDKAIEICNKNGGICIDLSEELNLKGTDFYDPIHTSPDGAQKIGRYLARKLSPILNLQKEK